ncbi:MAG: hypothetical protein ACYDHZ_00815 [Dehalococcoidia bacterium]
MPRESSPQRMPFFKMFSRDWLQGSIRFSTVEARALFVDLMALANESRTKRGMIQANETTPYPHSYLAQTLNIPVDKFEEGFKILKDTKRIDENGTGICVLNFEYYQNVLFAKKKKPGRPSKTPPEQSALPIIAGEAERCYDAQNLCDEMVLQYARCFGKDPDPRIAAQIRDFSVELAKNGCPTPFIFEAFKTAANENKTRGIAYVKKCLIDWMAGGKK